jgi:hypothetical protein
VGTVLSAGDLDEKKEKAEEEQFLFSFPIS